MQEIHAIVSGYVQGVNFRYYTAQRAKSLGLSGFVRNLLDGRVEVVAQGEKQELERLIEWLWHGPASASIEDIATEWRKPTEKFKGFSIKH